MTKRVDPLALSVAALVFCASIAIPQEVGPTKQVELSSRQSIARLTVDATQEEHTPWDVKHPKGAKIDAIWAAYDKRTGQVSWRYLPDKHFRRFEELTIVVAPAGEYLVTLGGSSIVKVLPSESRPSPSPGPSPSPSPPEPTPDPKPQPDQDKIQIDWVVWVEEISERSKHPKELATMQSLELRKQLEAKGIRSRVYDDDQEGAKPFLSKAKSLPAIMLIQEKPVKHLVFPAPKSVSETMKLIEEHGR